VAGFVMDLFESGETNKSPAVAVIQCHSAGADNFILWAQQWLDERMGVRCGVVKNDLDVRNRENVKLEVIEWGDLPREIYALEGAVRFKVDPRKGQKTGFFYDHRDSRRELALRASHVEGDILDLFSYVGGWGLQALKKHPKARLVAVDVSASALELLKFNAEANGMGGRIELVQADLFKDKKVLGSRKFGTVISDPPALTSSAKQASEGRRALEACFYLALGHLAPTGIVALGSCSYHLTWDEFFVIVGRAARSWNRTLRIGFIGSQGADHPILSTLPETRYLKAVIGDSLL